MGSCIEHLPSREKASELSMQIILSLFFLFSLSNSYKGYPRLGRAEVAPAPPAPEKGAAAAPKDEAAAPKEDAAAATPEADAAPATSEAEEPALVDMLLEVLLQTTKKNLEETAAAEEAAKEPAAAAPDAAKPAAAKKK